MSSPSAAEHVERGTTLPISEVFHTIQGEGPSTGTRAVFVRLGGCNLSCTWCDTPYTWDAERYDLRAEIRRTSVEEVRGALDAAAAPLLILTGGEPLLHQHTAGWKELVTAAHLRGMRVEVETNGTKCPDDNYPIGLTAVQRYVVSPKLAHAGGTPRQRIVSAALDTFADMAAHGRAVFKFVVRAGDAWQLRDDLQSVGALVAAHHLPAPAIWVMPQGTTSEAVLRGTQTLAPFAIERGWNLSTRLHTLIWGAERAR
jgi:7-carboxy-7-deazaguanine synthase